ncbi:putative alpha-galactosidase D [Penicillium brasilianum]|uniref:Alpha-galactosidase n=1 Tax=Penicillium brasilianum TaxID=104259 RepID=A0A1S9REB6_PENBI|nr:putative alpha-galactosidase D [Penicillium brasilianum]
MYATAIVLSALVAAPVALGAALRPRLDNGVAKTPPMGWNTYNHYSCTPNETIVKSNAKALVDLGLAALGYRYVTTDCGWTIANRTAEGSLTWNETLFPSGFPALGQYLHDLGLLFGVYEDAGIRSCQTDMEQAGSLYHEAQDAALFTSWKIDALKYDNCFSDAATGYPNVNYEPSTSPSPRYANMTKALAAQGRSVLFQICEWGVDFPALWAPALGHTWRIGNDIIPAWRAIFRTLNQAVPQTSFAGPGQWPDLDMLEVGNNILTTAEEQTHFSLWAILKSPLVIGGALKDEVTSISDASLAILSNKDVVSYNQDSLGVSATLNRRWSEEGYEVWSGPLSGGRTVAALINWADESRELTLDLPDVGIQAAGTLKDIWAGKTVRNVKSSYTATVAAHGVMLVELSDTTAPGTYPTAKFATSKGNSVTFNSIYANTTSANHTLVISFSKSSSKASSITVQSSSTQKKSTVNVPASSKTVSSPISLSAGSANTITIHSTLAIDSIQIKSPAGTYYPATAFTLAGSATLTQCGSGFCQPVGSKIGYLDSTNTASITVPATVSNTSSSKYLELDYINNDVAFSTSWGLGANSRNITVAVNGGSPVRLEVPLSGRHSELFGPGLGWWDTASLGVSIDGWKNGDNEVVVANVAGSDAFQTWGADFVGFRVFD